MLTENRGRGASFRPKSLSTRHYPHLDMPRTQERPQLASFHGLTSQLPYTTGVGVRAIRYGLAEQPTRQPLDLAPLAPTRVTLLASCLPQRFWIPTGWGGRDRL